MKEERKRQKKLEANFEEEYFEDEGGGRSVCVCVCVCVRVRVHVSGYGKRITFSTGVTSDGFKAVSLTIHSACDMLLTCEA